MDRVPIDSALVLTTTRIFNRPGEPTPASPLTVVGGLSLFQRTILTLQRGGISRFIVLAGDETEALQRQLRADERIRAEVRWLPVLEFSPGDPRTWEIFPGLFGASYLVVGAAAVFPASLVERVQQEARVGEPLVVVRVSKPQQKDAPPTLALPLEGGGMGGGEPVAYREVRPHSQRRDRKGVAPFSLCPNLCVVCAESKAGAKPKSREFW